MDSVVKLAQELQGTYTCPEFTVSGDFKAAYEWLRIQFERHDTVSGPIRPYTLEEREIENNKSLATNLKEIPPLHIG